MDRPWGGGKAPTGSGLVPTPAFHPDRLRNAGEGMSAPGEAARPREQPTWALSCRAELADSEPAASRLGWAEADIWLEASTGNGPKLPYDAVAFCLLTSPLM